MKIAVFLFSLAPAMAHAVDPITADEFERKVTGKTFSYAKDNEAYGAEEYFSDRRVRWTFLDGECFEGKWYEVGPQICFVYDNIDEPQCWTFFETGDQLTARFAGQSDASSVFRTAPIDGPLYCEEPYFGA